MPRTRTKSPTKPKMGPTPEPAPGFAAPPEVLTLAEAAAYLRVPEEEILQLVGPSGLPGRKIGSEWRFLRSALQHWLCLSPKPSSTEALHSLAGAWAGDPCLDQLLEEIYKRRGRLMSETGE
jgi:excisionase family DNA binding protein